ncbi:MAG: aminoglycoside phosphotransferase family protein [Opitutus sp.]|nr:aminoglycoside phosphotransferase family protein [Opitutus sp.]
MSTLTGLEKNWLAELSPVAAEFSLRGRLRSAQPHGNGHINATYILECDAAGAPTRYVLQKINHRIFKNVPALMANVQRVTQHVSAKQPRALALVPARDGSFVHRDAAGDWWRIYDYVERAITVERVTTEAQAREAARAFGEYQALLVDLPGGRLNDTIPNFHHTRNRFETLRRAVNEDTMSRAAGVRAEIDFAYAREADTDVLLDLLARGELTERVTHNDTKINNVMLDDVTGRCAAVIDLDTVMPGLSLYDFGDMVRTAASSAAEDSPDPSQMHVVLPYFRALVEGYLESAGAVLNATERAHLGFAGKVLAFETGLRFLTDHLQGDVYFRIHRPGHNLDRARTQFALVKSIEENTGAMRRIVEDSQ